MSLRLTVRLWIKPGQRAAFEAFEAIAFQRIRYHGGEILSVVRPGPASTPGAPDEIHQLVFPTDAAFAAYRADPIMAGLADQRATCIQATEVIPAQE